MYLIARFIEGVSLNGYEFLLDDNKVEMKFTTVSDAVAFLNKAFNEELTSAEEWDEKHNIFILDETECV